MRSKHEIRVPPLPSAVSLETIYSDFFGYLYRHTESFFQKRELNGTDIWQRLKPSTEFVIAHPNGWGAYEQAFLRTAAVKGGLVLRSQAADRVHFVSEAEASVHFALAHGKLGSGLKVCFSYCKCHCL
jgi:hypothetical protein